MATRREVIDSVTTVMRGTFPNVSNRFRTLEDLTAETQRGREAFPHWNVGLGPQEISFALAGDIEIVAGVPVYAIGMCKCEGEDLQLEVADLIDQLMQALRDGYTTFTDACFSLVAARVYPYEDEDRSDIGYVVAVLTFETGNS